LDAALAGFERAVAADPDSALMPAGCYLLYPTDQLMYLVNPSNKTYSMLDMAAISGMQRQAPQQQAGAGNPSVAADKLVLQLP